MRDLVKVVDHRDAASSKPGHHRGISIRRRRTTAQSAPTPRRSAHALDPVAGPGVAATTISGGPVATAAAARACAGSAPATPPQPARLTPPASPAARRACLLRRSEGFIQRLGSPFSNADHGLHIHLALLPLETREIDRRPGLTHHQQPRAPVRHDLATALQAHPDDGHAAGQRGMPARGSNCACRRHSRMRVPSG